MQSIEAISEQILYWLSLDLQVRALAERLLERFAVTVGDLPASAAHHHAEPYAQFGRPCLWQEFVLLRTDDRVCAAAVDRVHDTVMYQVQTLARRYAEVLEHLPSDFGLIVTVATERRYQLYWKWADRHVAQPFTQDTLQPINRKR